MDSFSNLRIFAMLILNLTSISKPNSFSNLRIFAMLIRDIFHLGDQNSFSNLRIFAMLIQFVPFFLVYYVLVT